MLIAETTTLDWITAIGAIATPVIVLLLTGAGYLFRERWTRNFKLFDTLRKDRVGIYNEILEPFVVMFTSEQHWKMLPENEGVNKDEKALKMLMSLEYKKAAFQMSLVADDAVVLAYNDLMQYAFRMSDAAAEQVAGENQGHNLLKLLAKLLLEIRKSTGNQSTKIDAIGMLEWFITDARTLRE